MAVRPCLLSLLLSILAAGPAFAQLAVTVTDPRDGQVYAVERHGDLEWFGRDLAFAHPRRACADEACDVVFYPFAGYDDLCPPGWRVPAAEDFEILAEALGASPAVGAPSPAGARLAGWAGRGFIVGGAWRRPPGHGVFLVAPPIGASDDGPTTVGWHLYPVEGGHAFEPTRRALTPGQPFDLAASVRCVRSAG